LSSGAGTLVSTATLEFYDTTAVRVKAGREALEESMALALTGLRVLCTGLEDDTAVCQQLVQELGGELLSRFSSERTPQVLIAKDVTTEKYRVRRIC
jgi:predicted protein tyrosine phosphatase